MRRIARADFRSRAMEVSEEHDNTNHFRYSVAGV
jgi:hypothetical protein